MVKSIIFQILNSFRIIAFWIYISLFAIGMVAVVRESKVNVTVKDGVLGDRINHYASVQEFLCDVDGETFTVIDSEGRESGDEVQVVFRDGEYYALVNPEFPDIHVNMWDRISFRYTDTTKGNDVFVLIAYIFFTLLTIKSRKDFRKEYPILCIITHVGGLVFLWLFFITAFWFDVTMLIAYGVIFGVIWIIRIIVAKKVVEKKDIKI